MPGEFISSGILLFTGNYSSTAADQENRAEGS